MFTLLAIDTTSARCTVALSSGNILISRTVESVKQNAQFVLPQIAELLAEAKQELQQIDAIAVLAGPGSFTGIRIGIGIAQGLGMANGTPVLPLSNLALKAYTAMRESGTKRALVCEVARDQEVYFAAYHWNEDSGVTLIGSEQADIPENVQLVSEFGALEDNWIAAGSGWKSVRGVGPIRSLHRSGEAIDPELNCHDFNELAKLRFSRGDAVPAASALPNYVKDALNYRR